MVKFLSTYSAGQEAQRFCRTWSFTKLFTKLYTVVPSNPAELLAAYLSILLYCNMTITEKTVQHNKCYVPIGTICTTE